MECRAPLEMWSLFYFLTVMSECIHPNIEMWEKARGMKWPQTCWWNFHKGVLFYGLDEDYWGHRYRPVVLLSDGCWKPCPLQSQVFFTKWVKKWETWLKLLLFRRLASEKSSMEGGKETNIRYFFNCQLNDKSQSGQTGLYCQNKQTPNDGSLTHWKFISVWAAGDCAHHSCSWLRDGKAVCQHVLPRLLQKWEGDMMNPSLALKGSNGKGYMSVPSTSHCLKKGLTSEYGVEMPSNPEPGRWKSVSTWWTSLINYHVIPCFPFSSSYFCLCSHDWETLEQQKEEKSSFLWTKSHPRLLSILER